MKIEFLTKENLKKSINSRVYSRGDGYYMGGRVHYFSYKDAEHKIVAVVKGKEDYYIAIDLSSGIVNSHCTCSTHKEFGFSQKFNLSLEAHTESKNVYFRTSYQYMKHGEDKLFIFSNDFSNVIANTAKSLEEWTNHSFLFDVGYRAKEKTKFIGVIPQISFFYKLPFNGKRSVLMHSIGITGSISF